MNPADPRLADVIDAFLHASLVLEQIVPGAQVDLIDGLTHIRYGRPKVGVQYEIVAGLTDPDQVLAALAADPVSEMTYLSTFTPLDQAGPTAYEDAGLPRVVRNTLMAHQLADVAPFADSTLKRITDPAELRRLVLYRGDNVLDVDHFTDAIGCYILDVEGEPVSSALLIPSTHASAMVEHVHTLANYRRRGYGRWLLRSLHAEAIRMGIHQTVLSSNAAGLPLYNSLGYTPLCYQDVYVIGTTPDTDAII